jgi:glycerate 2-kinase
MSTVVLAPDGFKGTVSGARAARALAAGWLEARPGDRVIERPMADGGEGTLDAFASAVPGARRMPLSVTGPDDREVRASWLLLPPADDAPGGTGVVELASTSGIELLRELRPEDAHTRGFGQAVVAALDHGVSRLVLGIGSSSSTDGGLGLLAALGARAVDRSGRPVPSGLRGLAVVAGIDLSTARALPPGGVIVITDVTSPLGGPHGAAHVFGPQKGLDPAAVVRADLALERLAALIPAVAPDTPGAGAAGGTGFALLAWGARLTPGAEEVALLVGLPGAIEEADAVVTGEGSYDGQSGAGKVPGYVARLSAARSRPVLLAAGRITADADLGPFSRAVSLTRLAGSASAAMAEPERWLRAAGRALASGWHPDS